MHNVNKMNPSNLNMYSKQEIQEENVRRGAARCANELRKKTEAKFVELWKKEHECRIAIDGEMYTIPLPYGKTKADFVAYILKFFSKQDE
jgi:hypothetical protein